MTKISNQYSLTNVLTADPVNGRVGIGTETPGNKLVISQPVSTTFGNAGTYIGLGGTENALGQTVLLGFGYRGSSTSEYPAVMGYLATNNGGNQSGALVFGTRDVTTNTAPTERMRIDSIGNVGVGVVPGSWNTTYKAIQLKDATSMAMWSGGYDANITSNAIATTLGGAVYGGAAAGAAKYTQYDGAHIFFSASAGTAGGTISFSERMRITSGGNVLIGTTSGGTSVGTGLVSSNSTYVQLRVQSTSQSAGIEWVSGTGYRYEVQGSNDGEWFIYNRTLETYRLMIKANGDFLVGKTASNDTVAGFDLSTSGRRLSMSAPDSTNGTNTYLMYSTAAGYRFYVGWGGQIYATSTSIAAISDISLKENIRDLDTGLNEILKLKPRRFDWIESTKIEEKNVAGFIAQELEEVLPELVYDYQYDKDIIKKSIKMGDIVPTLVKAIQEQQLQINELKALLNA